MAKDQFLRDKELVKKWVVVRNEFLDSVLTFARADMMESGPSAEEIKGAERLIHAMRNLPEGESPSFKFPSPGLKHQIDKMPEPLTDQPKPKENK